MKMFVPLLTLGLMFPAGAHADKSDEARNEFEITVTNVTRGQTFTPILVATHKAGVRLFTEGTPASPQLAFLAEDGDPGPLAAVLDANPDVFDTAVIGGLLGPGKSATVRIRMEDKFDHISVAAMLIPTNDAFFAVNGVRGPKGRRTLYLESPAYDAGSEPNDELCVSIPGPPCFGLGASPGSGEGFVHIHAGIHGIGGLPPLGLNAAERDWRNPVAAITIERVRR